MMKIFILIIPFVLLLSNCGILPPTEDLEVARSRLAKAEEVEADKLADEEYNQASELLKSGESLIVKEKKSGKNKKAKLKFKESKQKADAAFEKAAPIFTDKKINLAEDELTKADKIKASVAVSNMFSSCKKKIDSAKESRKEKNYSKAIELSTKAKEEAGEIYKITLKKKNRAENAIKEADNSIKRAEKKITPPEGKK